MAKFKAGDRIHRVRPDYEGLVTGDVVVVRHCTEGALSVDGVTYRFFNPDDFELVEEQKEKTMDYETYKALEESIKHWEDNLKFETSGDLSIGAADCSLCGSFNREDIDEEDHCKGCPVYLNTSEVYCSGTPHSKVYNLRNKLSATEYELNKLKEETRKAVQEELDFLKSLRPNRQMVKPEGEYFLKEDGWKAGDIVRCVSTISSCYSVRKEYKLEESQFELGRLRIGSFTGQAAEFTYVGHKEDTKCPTCGQTIEDTK